MSDSDKVADAFLRISSLYSDDHEVKKAVLETIGEPKQSNTLFSNFYPASCLVSVLEWDT